MDVLRWSCEQHEQAAVNSLALQRADGCCCRCRWWCVRHVPQVRRKLMNTRRKMEEMLNGGGGQLATAGDAADADEWYATEEELAQPLLTIYW